MKNQKPKKRKKDLQNYLNQLEKDTKPILTFADIDQKTKSGFLRSTFLEPLPKLLKVLLAIVVIGSILYGLFSNIIVSLGAGQ